MISRVLPIYKVIWQKQPEQKKAGSKVRPKADFKDILDKEIESGLHSTISIKI